MLNSLKSRPVPIIKPPKIILNKTVCDRCKVECSELNEIKVAFIRESSIGPYQSSRSDYVCEPCHSLWTKQRVQDKDRFYTALSHKIRIPRCVRCDKKSRFLSGDPNSMNIFEDAEGLCNTCFHEFLSYYAVKEESFMGIYVPEPYKPKPKDVYVKSCHVCSSEGDHTRTWYFKHLKKYLFLCSACYESVLEKHNAFFNAQENESKSSDELDKEVYDLYMKV